METEIQKQSQQREGQGDLEVREKRATRGGTGTYEGPYFEPAVDIYETADAIAVDADVPGARVEDIETDLRDNELTLIARVSPPDPKWKPVYQEYAIGHYMRRFRIGQQIDQSKIAAELHDGVLTLVLPKSDQAKPRKIQIKAG